MHVRQYAVVTNNLGSIYDNSLLKLVILMYTKLRGVTNLPLK